MGASALTASAAGPFVVAQVRVLQSTCNAARGGSAFLAGVKTLPYKTGEFLEIFNCIWPAMKFLEAVSLSPDACAPCVISA